MDKMKFESPDMVQGNIEKSLLCSPTALQGPWVKTAS
jgi:hypothetical protein